MPLSKVEKEMVFVHMLHKCQFSKFQEVNFKILARILLSRKILSVVREKNELSRCLWCLGSGSLEHYLFSCVKARETRALILHKNCNLLSPWSTCVWCFGAMKSELNPIVLVVNFGIYKAMIQKVEGYHIKSLYDFVCSECSRYEHLFHVLTELQW